MDLSKWFDYQLRSTLDGFTWAVQQLPFERLSVVPPTQLGLGDWSVSQHVLHMLEYERDLVLPSMHQWVGASPVPRLAHQHDLQSVEETLGQFKRIRLEEINLLPRISGEAWEAKQNTTFWGEVSLYWLVCKTYQHTTEHTHDILSLALFWDRRLARLADG